MLGYLGIHCEWKTSGYEVVEYADTLPRLDLILDGHPPAIRRWIRRIEEDPRFGTFQVQYRSLPSPQKPVQEQMKKRRIQVLTVSLGKPLDPDRFPDQIRRILNGEAVWEFS
jgi:two-component system, cell cycle response regulator DivK